MQGNYTISAVVDPSFILQGLLGSTWGKLFGVSFESLRYLTIIAALIFFLGIYKILYCYKISPNLIFTTLLLIFFNPLIFTSTLSFMTEMYFLLFLAWSMYFYLKSLDKPDDRKNVFFGSLFCALSILVRQVGIVTYIAYIIVLLFFRIKFKKPVFLSLVISSIPIVFSLIVLMVWPKYGGGLFSNLIQEEQWLGRLTDMSYSLIYLVFFLSPLALSLTGKLSRISKILVSFLSIPVSLWIYSLDIFPLGNVFYVESFYAKSNFRTNFSLFDNIFFKLGLSFYISLSLLILLYFLTANLKKALYHSNIKNSFLLLISFGMLSVLFFGNDFYDRYLLPTFISVVLLFVFIQKNLTPRQLKTAIAGTVLIAFITLVLQFEFMQVSGLKWRQAGEIQVSRQFVTSVHVSDVFTKYSNVQKQKDYTGLISMMPKDLKYKCYIQNYTLEPDKGFFAALGNLNELAGNYVKNPKITESKKTGNLPNIKKHMTELIYNQEYMSPLYNLVGKKAFVGSWCN